MAKKQKVTFEQMESARIELANAEAHLNKLKEDEITLKRELIAAKSAHASAKSALNQILHEYINQ